MKDDDSSSTNYKQNIVTRHNKRLRICQQLLYINLINNRVNNNPINLKYCVIILKHAIMAIKLEIDNNV